MEKLINQEEVLTRTKEFVYNELHREPSGHDWWHIVRVSKMAKRIAVVEKANLFICEMAALLHDIADEKLNESEEEGIKKVTNWLTEIAVDEDTTNSIIEIVSTLSFKGGGRPEMATLEGKIVQDADRLDAIGAIGIARTFAYAGAKGDLIYEPTIKPREKMTKEEYRNGQSTAINHFYEKLLKLKNMMNTPFAIKIAEERHQRMEQFLDEFFQEWNEY